MAEGPRIETSDGVTTMGPVDEGPPERGLTPREWLRENLFRDWWNTLLTVVFGLLLGSVIVSALRFVFFTGRWTVIRVNLTNFMVGLFPRGEMWRPWVALFVIAAFLALSLGMAVRRLSEAAVERGTETGSGSGLVNALRRTWPVLTLVVILLVLSGSPTTTGLVGLLVVVTTAAFLAGRRVPSRHTRWWLAVLLAGVGAFFFVLMGLGGVAWDKWGGLLLTMYFAVGAIILSFPLGVGLALGRRSSFPAIRVVTVTYIELIRGVPLITLLFMGNFMLQFVVPPQFAPGSVVRALIAFTLFTAAYVAEIVRGGLQSVPRGQVEAAQAVGLSPLKVTRLVVLPQALRAVIPALVGQFISLFKDTSLAAIIGGLTEFLFIALNVTNQPRFVGQALQAETLTFAAFVYWVFAYTMSKESQRLERRLGVGER